jgi:hypothetical protein
MKRLTAAAAAFLCLLFGSSLLQLLVPPPRASAQLAPIVADGVTYGVSVSNTTLEIVPATAAKKIYVTFAHVESAGAGNLTFVYGTGTNCGIGQVAIGGAISLTAQTGFAGGAGVGSILTVPAGNALCITNSAAVQMSGWLTAAKY